MPTRNRCPSCGKRHVPGFAYCQRCGAPLNEPSVVSDRAPEAEAKPSADEAEAEFQVVRPQAGQPPKARGRMGCAGIFAALLIVAVAFVIRISSFVISP